MFEKQTRKTAGMSGPAMLWKRSTREKGLMHAKKHQTNSSENQGWQQNDMSNQ